MFSFLNRSFLPIAKGKKKKGEFEVKERIHNIPVSALFWKAKHYFL